MEPKDIISIVISGIALAVSIISFVLNRHYARTLFETTNYPDMEISVNEVDHPGEELISYKSRAVYSYSGVIFEARNKTTAIAVNGKLRLILILGNRRIVMSDQPDRWKTLGALASATAVSGYFIGVASAQLLPDQVHLKLEPSTNVRPGTAPFDKLLLEKNPGSKVSTLDLVIECMWEPALRSKKILRQYILCTLEAREITKGSNLIRWRPKQKKSKLPLWLYGWRPKTLDLID